MQHDPLADALSKINNAARVGKYEVQVRPASRMLGKILSLMQTKGYIDVYEYLEDGKAGVYKIKISDRLNKCQVVKPRFSVRVDEIQKFEQRYLPARQFGMLIMTTPMGIMTHHEALEKNTGGKILAYVY